jgi:hypothetical protein
MNRDQVKWDHALHFHCRCDHLALFDAENLLTNEQMHQSVKFSLLSESN